MRKTLFSLLAVTVLLTAIGCASTGKRTLFSETPVALVSIASNYDINWKGEKPTTESIAGSAIRRLLRTDESLAIVTKADVIIDDAEEIIRSTLDNSPNFSLAPKDSFLRSRSYIDARLNPYQENDKMIAPTGYRLVYHREKNFYPAFARETGIERTLFITLDLTKEMSFGAGKNGRCRGKVDMAVLLKDSRGKTLFNKIYQASSLGETQVRTGAYSQEELLDLLRSAIGDACLDFLDDLK